MWQTPLSFKDSWTCPSVETPRVPKYRLAPDDQKPFRLISPQLIRSQVFSIVTCQPLGKWKIVKSQWNPSSLGELATGLDALLQRGSRRLVSDRGSGTWGRGHPPPRSLQLSDRNFECPGSAWSTCYSSPKSKTKPSPLKKIIQLHLNKSKNYWFTLLFPKKLTS